MSGGRIAGVKRIAIRIASRNLAVAHTRTGVPRHRLAPRARADDGCRAQCAWAILGLEISMLGEKVGDLRLYGTVHALCRKISVS
jgi:hypothetical protein